MSKMKWKVILIIGWILEKKTTSCIKVEVDGTMSIGEEILKELQKRFNIQDLVDATEEIFKRVEDDRETGTDQESDDKTTKKTNYAENFIKLVNRNRQAVIDDVQRFGQDILNTQHTFEKLMPFVNEEHNKEYKELEENLKKLEDLSNEKERTQHLLDYMLSSKSLLLRQNAQYLSDSLRNMPNYSTTYIKIHTYLRQKIEEVEDKELRYLCDNYSICRPINPFSDNFAEWIAHLIGLSDDKIKQFFSALIEEVKETKYAVILEDNLIEHVERYLDKLYSAKGDDVYINLASLIHSAIVNRYKPIDTVNKLVTKETVLFRDILHTIDNAYAGKDEEWAQTTQNLQRWSENNIKDINEIIRKELDSFSESYQTWKPKDQEKFRNDVNALCKYLVQSGRKVFSKDSDWWALSDDYYV